ncbi:mucin-19-like [Pomacea canaliculata]|uniref:mucin-19-like n=1 Tax=Pomacea canaliculata TaxID=400727 RepID=UPI000D7361F5|nr:mucin-19-like [Pomacea canaliculata]
MKVLLLFLLLTSSTVSAAHPKRSLLGSFLSPTSSGTSLSGTGGLLDTGTSVVVNTLGDTASSPGSLLDTGTSVVVNTLGDTASSPGSLLDTGTSGVVDTLVDTAGSLADGITAGAGCENGVNVGLPVIGGESGSGVDLLATVPGTNILDTKIVADVGVSGVLSTNLEGNLGIIDGQGGGLTPDVLGTSILGTNLGGTDGLNIGPVDEVLTDVLPDIAGTIGTGTSILGTNLGGTDGLEIGPVAGVLTGVLPDIVGTTGTGGTDCLTDGTPVDVDSLVRPIVQSAMLQFQAAIIVGLQAVSMVSDIFIKLLANGLVIVVDLVVFIVQMLLSSSGLLKLGCGTSLTGLSLIRSLPQV